MLSMKKNVLNCGETIGRLKNSIKKGIQLGFLF